MSNDTVVSLASPARVSDPLTEFLRSGARRLIEAAVRLALNAPDRSAHRTSERLAGSSELALVPRLGVADDELPSRPGEVEPR